MTSNRSMSMKLLHLCINHSIWLDISQKIKERKNQKLHDMILSIISVFQCKRYIIVPTPP